MSNTINFYGQEMQVQETEMPTRRRTNTDSDDLANLPVGQDVFYECDKDEAAKIPQRVAAVGKRFGMKFTTRKLEGGVGIWRTA